MATGVVLYANYSYICGGDFLPFSGELLDLEVQKQLRKDSLRNAALLGDKVLHHIHAVGLVPS